MEVKAQLRNLRIAPRKVRLVVNVIRGMSIDDAEAQLQFLQKRSAVPVLKLIRSAVANAEHNHKLNRSDLYIKTIEVNDGSTLKRWKPRAMGRATMIRKRSSHINVVLDVTAQAKQAARVQTTGKKKADAKTDAVVKDSKKVVAKKRSPKIIDKSQIKDTDKKVKSAAKADKDK